MRTGRAVVLCCICLFVGVMLGSQVATHDTDVTIRACEQALDTCLTGKERCDGVVVKQHCSLLEAESELRTVNPEWDGFWSDKLREANEKAMSEAGGCP